MGCESNCVGCDHQFLIGKGEQEVTECVPLAVGVNS